MFSTNTLALQNQTCLTGMVQYTGTFGTEYFADGQDIKVNVQKLIQDHIGDITLLEHCGEVGRPVTSDDFIAKIDIDLLPIGGGHGELGETNRTTSSEATVIWTSGKVQNMDGQGSVTIGPILQDPFYKICGFSEFQLKEGSGVKVTYIVASKPTKP